METDIELSEGQSFAIGGLIDNRVQESLNKVPGLSSIPLLGTLFKSSELRKNLSELVVMVTPEIARPLAPGEPAPIPAMPHEFLVPLTPDSRQSSGPNRSRADSPAGTQGKDAQKAQTSKTTKPKKG
jgi:pilus assembly protein CpaC